MDIQACMDEVANQADAFLQPADGRPTARVDILDYVNRHHPELPAPDRTRIVSGVLAILEEEDFWGDTQPTARWPVSGEDGVDGT